MTDLDNTLSYQMSFVNFDQYKNELQTMRAMFSIPDSFKESRLQLWRDFFKSQADKLKTLPGNDIEKSNQLREEGNKVFTSKDKERNLLVAARHYTDAIYAAPAGSLALALAHANRAVALQEFGFFQQAYDDCVCAIEQGYPNRLAYKVMVRQAFCAWKLGDAKRLKLHLKPLENLSLNTRFTSQVKELQAALTKLENNEPVKQAAEGDMHLKREAQTVRLDLGDRRRCLVASEAIEENELIFSDYASSFVTLGKYIAQVCNQCAATNLIPFPCYRCSAVYCSVKCRMEDVSHVYECTALSWNLLPQMGATYLALRIVLAGLPTIIPYLRRKLRAEDIWVELARGGSIEQSTTIKYGKVLRMCSHIDKWTRERIMKRALASEMLACYLDSHTHFFNLVRDTNARRSDWKLIAAALILRHSAQMIVNGVTCAAMVLKEPTGNTHAFLEGNLWSSPFHVKRGLLHKFSSYEDVTIGCFPHISNCNYVCKQTFNAKFSGRYICAYASKNIEVGEEKFTCYHNDYRESTHRSRTEDLKRICVCRKCTLEHQDQDYEIFHQYRCKSCRHIFVPQIPFDSLRWWNYTDSVDISCTNCGWQQRYSWRREIDDLLESIDIPVSRILLYKYFADLDEWLIGMNEFKTVLASKIIRVCYHACFENNSFTKTDFVELERIITFLMASIAEQSGTHCLDYCIEITYLWDLIAVGKLKRQSDELETTLSAIEILADDMKLIFKYYYQDYIEPLLKETDTL